MLFLSTLPGVAFSVVVLTALLAPPGYALLVLARHQSVRLDDLPLALGAGGTVGLPVLLLEYATGVPLLLPALAVASLLVLRGASFETRPSRRSLWVLGVALAAAAFAAFVNHDDLLRVPGGIAYRVGFDVSDKAFYALVGQELTRARPPHLENPLFAGVPLPYSVFHPLTGLLLERYAGVDLTLAMMVGVPAVGLSLAVLALARLLLDLGHQGRLVACVGGILLALGGDLSPLGRLAGDAEAPLARVGHFFLFHSFAAESLYYNAWMLALPVVLVGLTLSRRWLDQGGAGDLLLAGLVLGGLWQVKVFAVLGLGVAMMVGALVFWNRRLALLAVATGGAALPSLALTLATGASREGWPLLFVPFHHVRESLAQNALLQALLAPQGTGQALGWASLAFVTPAFLAGGFGVRLVGLVSLLRSARRESSRFPAFLALAVLVLTLLSLLMVGNPVPVDGAQFLTLAQMLLWIPTAPVIAGLIGGKGMLRRSCGVGLLLAAVISPLGYVVRKAAPAWTPPGSIDRVRFVLDDETLAAADWLRAHSRRSDRVLVPPSTGLPSDPGGLYGFYVALATSRRVVAAHWDGHIAAHLAQRRVAEAYAVLSTSEAPRAEALLDALKVRWVWEHADRPLRFRSARLTPVFRNARVTLHLVEPPDGPPPVTGGGP